MKMPKFCLVRLLCIYVVSMHLLPGFIHHAYQSVYSHTFSLYLCQHSILAFDSPCLQASNASTAPPPETDAEVAPSGGEMSAGSLAWCTAIAVLATFIKPQL